MKITIPESYAELSVGQFKELNGAWTGKGDEMARALACIKITCNLSEQQIRLLSDKDVKQVIAHLQWLLNPDEQQDHPLIPTFYLDGTEYGFVPDWTQLSIGEMIDLETFAKEGFYETLEKTMAVMYRRVTRRVGSLYEIEAYQPSKFKDGVMQAAPMSAAMGAMLFFSRIGRRLAHDTLNYLKAEAADQR